MKKSKRVTYTLKEVDVDIINHYSKLYNLPKSKFVSLCIEYGFRFMEEELEEFRNNDDESLYIRSRKFSDTTPKTFTLPKDIIDMLNYYSKELKVKKSHLVGVSIYLMYEKIKEDENKKHQKDMDNQIEELMEMCFKSEEI